MCVLSKLNINFKKATINSIFVCTTPPLGSVQFSRSVVFDSLRPHGWQHTRRPCPSPNPKLIQIYVHQVGDVIQQSHPMSSPSPPAFNLSQHQGLFKWVSSSHHVAKVLEFQLQYHPSNKYWGLISFKIDWFDLFAVQGTPLLSCPINMESSMELCSLSAGPALQPKLTSLCGVAVQDQGILMLWSSVVGGDSYQTIMCVVSGVYYWASSTFSEP